MKTLNPNLKKIVLGGILALALLPLLGSVVSHSQKSANPPAVTQVADGSETHGSKPPKGA